LLAGGLVLLAVLPVHAQQALDGSLYGRGTHAYFSRDFVKAHELLTTVIDADASDPRPFYFRGLVYLRLNRPEEARLDFQKGAELEAGDSNVFYDVSKSLVRVQGKQRLAIEEYRARARLAEAKRSKAVHRARFEAIKHEEDRVVRKNISLTPGSFAQPGQPESAVVEAEPAKAAPAVAGEQPAATETDPFAPAATPASAPAATESDPFAPAPASAPAVAAEDPFAEPAAAKAAVPGEPKKGGLWGAIGEAMGKTLGPSESAGGPPPTGPAPTVPFGLPGFGGPAPSAAPAPAAQPPVTPAPAAQPPTTPTPPPAKPAEVEDDPFAADTPAAPAPATPPAPSQPTEEEDPFGTKPATPATAPPAKPAEVEDDPFAADTPAASAPATPAPAAPPAPSQPTEEEDPFDVEPAKPATSPPATTPPAKQAEEEEDPFAAAPASKPGPSAKPVGIPVSQGQGAAKTETTSDSSQGGAEKKSDSPEATEGATPPVAPVGANPFEDE